MYKNIREFKKPDLLYPKFLLLLLLAYFPLWSQLMSLKNDALTLSYPLFHFFSVQLQNGHIPWWHYNLNLGLPLHADPGFPFWSPITWLWATGGNSLCTYSLLLMFYVILAGVGMLKLTGWFKLSSPVRLLISLAFPLSGFFNAHLQHPHYIYEAAFLPFVLLFFLKSVYQPQTKNSIFLAVSLFFLLNSGYPSFSISAAYFFAVLFLAILLRRERQATAPDLKKVVIHLVAGLAIAIVLSLPYLCSLIEFYPFYNRGAGLADNYIQTGGLSIRSLLSLLFPLASVSDPAFFQTDRAWSNVFLGLLPLIAATYCIIYIRHSLKWPLLISGVFMLAASMQGPLKAILYKALPLYNRMHSNGGLRIYFILTALLLAGIGLEQWLKKPNTYAFRMISVAIAAAIVITIVCAFLFLPGNMNINSGIQQFLKTLSLRNALIIQAAIVLSVLLLFNINIKKPHTLLAIAFAELIVTFIINVPYTGLGLDRTPLVQQHLNTLKEKYETQQDSRLVYEPSEIRDQYFNDPVLFINRPGLTRVSTYPSGFVAYYQMMKAAPSSLPPQMQPVFERAPDKSLQPTLSGMQFTSDRISFNVSSFHPGDTLVVAQNFYRNWAYRIDDKAVTSTTAYGGFTGILPQNSSFRVMASYDPGNVLICFVISIFAWAGIAIVLVKTSS